MRPPQGYPEHVPTTDPAFGVPEEASTEQRAKRKAETSTPPPAVVEAEPEQENTDS